MPTLDGRSSLANLKVFSVLCLADIFAAALMTAQNRGDPGPSEQRQFSAEDEAVKRPVRLRREVLAQLARDPDIRRVLGNEKLL